MNGGVRGLSCAARYSLERCTMAAYTEHCTVLRLQVVINKKTDMSLLSMTVEFHLMICNQSEVVNVEYNI